MVRPALLVFWVSIVLFYSENYVFLLIVILCFIYPLKCFVFGSYFTLKVILLWSLFDYEHYFALIVIWLKCYFALFLLWNLFCSKNYSGCYFASVVILYWSLFEHLDFEQEHRRHAQGSPSWVQVSDIKQCTSRDFF